MAGATSAGLEPEEADMWQSLKRWWKYLGVKVRVVHEERADPKVQLEQAILEARTDHRRLSDAAALVVAQQKQAQDRLDTKVAECDKAKASAGQALLMIDREARLGHTDKVDTFTTAAEGLANRVLGLEREVRELDEALLQATRAAEQAKGAVVQNATTLQSKLDEQERLLSVLDRAKMQEALNDARGQLDGALGDDVPTFAEVERKIHARNAVAQAKGELTALQASAQVDPGLLEIESAQRSAEAQALLAQMAVRLGLPAPGASPASASPRELER
jgi:phage shock protein A